MPAPEQKTQQNTNSQSQAITDNILNQVSGTSGVTTNNGTTSSTTNGQQSGTTSSDFNSQNNPYAPAEDNLKKILYDASSYASVPGLFAPTQGQTTQDALASLKNIAQAGSAATDPLTNIVNGATSGFNTGSNTLTNTASGANLDNNPVLKNILDRVANDTQNQVNQHFSGVGRYGSASHEKALGDAIANVRQQGELANYNAERGYQNQAANTLYGGGFQGAAVAPAIDASRLLTPQLLAQAGGIEDAQATAEKQAPLNATQWLSQITNPIAGLGGTQSGSTTGSSNSNSTAATEGSTTEQQVQNLINYLQQNSNTQQNTTSTGNTNTTQSVDNPMGTIIGALTSGLGLLKGAGGLGIL